MTNPAPAPVTRPVNPVPPEGTPVLVIVEGYEDFHSFLVEIGEEALPGTRVIAVLNPETAYAALVIHAEDVVGLVTNLRHPGWSAEAIVQMAEEALERPLRWGILTGALQLPSPDSFSRPPVAVRSKMMGLDELKSFLRLFTPFAPVANGQATAS